VKQEALRRVDDTGGELDVHDYRILKTRGRMPGIQDIGKAMRSKKHSILRSWIVKTRIFVVVLAFAVVATLAFSVGETEEDVAAEEVEAGVPQYGGTLTIFHGKQYMADPPSPDIADGMFPFHWLQIMQERPIIGDFEKYGIRGTGEFSFQLRTFIPEKFMKGNVLESWEVSPENITWRIRPGIDWQDVPHIMKARELTAEDVVADVKYFLASPPGKSVARYIGDVYATDRYTAVLEFTKFDLGWYYRLGYEDRAIISPPETEGSKKWEDQVGTGPFIFKEYVVGSHMSFKSNPDWWKTTIIDGVEYQVPFVDEIIKPIIPDEATQMAALRTAKLDYVHYVPVRQWENLDTTAPELVSARLVAERGMTVALKTSEAPFDDVNVRRALMIGTDMKAFADAMGVGPLPTYWFPMYPGNPTVFTTLEELPSETRLLFDYNPELARQMLADAGYPDGFEMEHWTATEATELDAADLLKYQWAQIGVDVKIMASDYINFDDARRYKRYSHSVMDFAGTANPTDALVLRGGTDQPLNYADWSDEYFDEMLAKIAEEEDYVERDRLIKKAAAHMLNEAKSIPLYTEQEGLFWWPWVNNFYGETNLGDNDNETPLAYAWIDQKLKTEMGY
jgi:peptide/nickel transport system substrate-binding protein